MLQPFPLTRQSQRRARVEGDHSAESGEPELRTHEGYEWLYVLSGCDESLGEHDITMPPGEVAEFDTNFHIGFGPADDQPVEILSVHGATASACTSALRHRGKRLRLTAAGATGS